jgi:hypothetical protein
VSGLNFWERQVLGAIADALGPDSAILVGNAFTSYMKVKDTNFSETFAAVPENGWYFEKWNAGDSFFCGNSTNPTCRVSNEEFENHIEIYLWLCSEKTFYLRPIFWREPHMVTVRGKTWLETRNFPYTADGVLAVRPGPDGICAGSLEIRHPSKICYQMMRSL